MKSDWKLLQRTGKGHLNAAIHEYHRLAQLIALAGKHLIETRSDDSQTSMSWSSEKWKMLGEPIQTAGNSRFNLCIENMHISLVDETDSTIGLLNPVNLLKSDAITKMNQMLENVGIQGTIKDELHFNIPEDLAAGYTMPSTSLVLEHLHLRHNADLVLTEIADKNNLDEKVRIWPHHFDSGSLIPLMKEKGEPSLAIGFGMAIADAYYPTPYFYVNFWDKGNKFENLALPGLKNKGQLNLLDWKGYILGIDQIVESDNASDQQEIVQQFLNESIEGLRKILN